MRRSLPSSAPRRSVLATALVSVALTVTVIACGSSSSSGDALPKGATAAAERGRTLVQQNGCTSCHTLDGGRSTGPTWKDLAGRPRDLANGATVVADRAYLTTAIADPKAQVVEGFPPIMPTYGGLSTTDVADLVAYLEQVGAR